MQKRFKTKSIIPTLSLWGIDQEKTFNAVLFESVPPDDMPQYKAHQKNHFVLTTLRRKRNLTRLIKINYKIDLSMEEQSRELLKYLAATRTQNPRFKALPKEVKYVYYIEYQPSSHTNLSGT